MILRQVSQIIQKAAGSDLEPEVEYTDPKFGDFATNIAFKLAVDQKASPKELAEKIAGHIKDPVVESATVAGPGFINLKMTPAFWLDQLAAIDAKYGAGDLGKGQKTQVEFISANPTGPLTLANARGGYLGDVLANVLGWSGHKVTREYYINDAGNQIAELAKSIAGEGDQYQGEYIKELAGLDGDAAVQQIMERYIKPAVAKMGIKFDVWFSEKSISADLRKEVLDHLKKHDLVFEQEGATWVKTTAVGDDRDRVLIRKDGQPTYLDSDLAYHLDILEERKHDLAIKIWGADHAGQVLSLAKTVEKISKHGKVDFVILQMVRLLKDGQEFKVSKRAGTYVTVDELLEQIPSDVARFFFLTRSPDSHMDFDLDLAKEESQKNPYWYVMYAFARANSILEKAKERGLKTADGAADLNAKELQLVREMSKLPGVITEIAADYGVQRLTHYGQEVARHFHDYYESERIIDLEPEEAAKKLYVLQQFTTFMKVYFRLLDISPIEKMGENK